MCLSEHRAAECRRSCPARKIGRATTITVAKLYAKMGFSDRSLEYLRKAMEEGYKDFKNVYKDTEFADLAQGQAVYRTDGDQNCGVAGVVSSQLDNVRFVPT